MSITSNSSALTACRDGSDRVVPFKATDDHGRNALPHLVILIPALNEGASIGAVVSSIPRKLAGVGRVDILVVDDGSTDDTCRLARDTGAAVVSHERNCGVGRAYATGVDRALEMGADIIVNIDADGQFNAADIPTLIGPILDGNAEFVTASRFKDPDLTPVMSTSRLLGNRLVSLIISIIVGRRFYDVSCGFRALTRETALRLNLTSTFTYTQEAFLDLAAKGIYAREVPLVVQGTREHGKSRIASNLLNYGHRAGRIILRAYRDYWPWQFFCSLSAVAFLLSFIFGGWLLYWRATSGAFSPHIWSGFVGAFFFTLGTIFVLIGMIADMLRMIRLNAEQLLYFEKKRHYNRTPIA